jgi:hypothetical protein
VYDAIRSSNSAVKPLAVRPRLFEPLHDDGRHRLDAPHELVPTWPVHPKSPADSSTQLDAPRRGDVPWECVFRYKRRNRLHGALPRSGPRRRTSRSDKPPATTPDASAYAGRHNGCASRDPRRTNRPSKPLVLVRSRAQGHHGPGVVSNTSVPPRSINEVVIISRCSHRRWSVRATGVDRPVSTVANTTNNVDRIPMKTFGLTIGIWVCRIFYICCPMYSPGDDTREGGQEGS